VRAVLEGVAYGLRDVLDVVRALGVRADVGRLSGGGGRSALWRTIVASTLGVPLERTAQSDHGAAFGAALLAGVRSGAFADAAEAVAACVRIADRTEPDPGWASAYDEGYARFRELYPALLPLEAEMNEEQ
jgi:xylulokinase